MLLIQNDITNEFLTPDEIEKLTGSNQKRTQIKWLQEKQWEFSVTNKGGITIGRWYARLKMSGVALKDVAVDTSDVPHFDKVS